jgi:hypothetical protein
MALELIAKDVAWLEQNADAIRFVREGNELQVELEFHPTLQAEERPWIVVASGLPQAVEKAKEMK